MPRFLASAIWSAAQHRDAGGTERAYDHLVQCCVLSTPELCACRAQLGAQVVLAPDEATTHVVAARDCTDKVLWARKHARFAVSPLWLHSSGARRSGP